MKKSYFVAAGLVAALGVQAGEMEKRGIKVGERMTLRPYVSMSYTYDSNIDSGKHSKAGSQWMIKPGLHADYLAENWKLTGHVWYDYHAYNHYTSQLNQSSFGEQLGFDYANSEANEAGWRINLSEQFRQIAQDDDMSNSGGRGIGRDRKEFTASGVIERRINEHWHGGLTGSYYLLDYDNNVDKYASLYGWKRLTTGAEFGYTASKWTDLIVAADYQWYWQDNSSNHDVTEAAAKGRHISSDSEGFSLMGGIGTHATERISYKVLAGWSRFDYGGGAKEINGWTYRATADWKVSDTMTLALLGSSYYQPSEREYGSALKVNTVSLGLAKSFIRGKLRGTVDLAYRRGTHEYTEYAANDYDEDIWTARVGLSYTLNRYFDIFGNIEYQDEETEGGSGIGHKYDYDRWRGTVGVRLTY